MSAALLAACEGKEQRMAATPVNTEEKLLNIYNWPNYVPEGMIAAFEKETGIKVNYDTFKTDETLEAKLVAGNTGYDIVVPSSVFAKTQIEAQQLQPLDKSKIPNLVNLDPAIMKVLTRADPGNKYLVPWAWGFTTVGINKTKADKALVGLPMPDNAWVLVFNPKYTEKLKSCGIAYLDSPSEVMPVALHYIGKDAWHPNNAQAFINFYLRPENGARVTNALNYPTANKAAIAKIKSDIASNTSIFVESDYFSKMIAPGSFSSQAREAMANAYNGFKQGR